mgnify:CR=1 FL=1
MKKISKKLLCLFSALSLLLPMSVFAKVQDEKSSTDAEETYVVKALKSDEEYDYSSRSVYICRNKATNEIIPLGIGPFDGYSYAFLPKQEEFTVSKESYENKYTDILEGKTMYYDMYIRQMTARGVFSGYDDGSFGAKRTLTRAQMAVVFARMFSIEPVLGVSYYSDVPADNWAAGSITALADIGVFSKTGTFNPASSVTREQLVVMTHRMLDYLGYAEDKGDVDYSKYQDVSEISDYAAKSYDILLSNGYFLPVDVELKEVEDSADDEYFFNPQKYLTRHDCVLYLYDMMKVLLSKNAPVIRRDDAPTQEIPILDGSTSTYEITNNIYNHYYINSENSDAKPKKHSKTSNSYKRLIDGEVELIFVPDPSDEIKKYAQDKGVKLKYVPIANEALVFFTSSENNVKNITREQLYEIYVNNSINNWKTLGGDDKYLAAYCRNNDSGSHAQMEKFILNGHNINEEISRERTSVLMANILTDVIDYNKMNKSSYAIGYSLYYYYTNMKAFYGSLQELELMDINGIQPNDDTISSGQYPFTTYYYAVCRDEENPKVSEFIKLLQSDFGDLIIKLSGLGVMKR